MTSVGPKRRVNWRSRTAGGVGRENGADMARDWDISVLHEAWTPGERARLDRAHESVAQKAQKGIDEEADDDDVGTHHVARLVNQIAKPGLRVDLAATSIRTEMPIA